MLFCHVLISDIANSKTGRCLKRAQAWLYVTVKYSYLDGLLLFENRREVRQDEANILLFGALLGNQQHVG